MIETWNVFSAVDVFYIAVASVGFMTVVASIPYAFGSISRREAALKYYKEQNGKPTDPDKAAIDNGTRCWKD